MNEKLNEKPFVGCDAHKRYSQFAILNEQGQVVKEVRVYHCKGAISSLFSHEDAKPLRETKLICKYSAISIQ